ncbi:hypothetical protein KY290_021469 [Solanum tuberosum]|uniref:Uncharacterized protein n=1 Tax=Solanum tuberosum TaxID=4113 RepID=A0ABQ7V1M3_SOLTU|nr:hypothetical protein KY289_020623 [Solanum tuberosum]KAH0693274.1 hypothetical protein KY285_020371 [Solanum tuberosum]KAH0757976.1 hypothetical protein KY290_021469 [Solanum tuberosum]
MGGKGVDVGWLGLGGWAGEKDLVDCGGAIGVDGGRDEVLVAGGVEEQLRLGWVRVERTTRLGGVKKTTGLGMG